MPLPPRFCSRRLARRDASDEVPLPRAAGPLPRVAVLFAVLSLAGCVRAGADYPRDWPRLAWSWSCPEITGQWRLGGQRGVDMGVLAEVPRMFTNDRAPASWDVVSISFDSERTMSVRLGRNPAQAPDRPELLPALLRPYADRLSYKRPRSPYAGVTSMKWGLVSNQYQCSGHKLWFRPSASDDTRILYLSRDVAGNLVAELADDPAAQQPHRWSHWPAITPSEFATAETTEHSGAQAYDAGPAQFGQAGEHDVADVKDEVKFELESGAKLLDLVAAGRGTVLATIEAPDEKGIRTALDHAADARRFVVELWRFDPTRGGEVRADVLLTPKDPSPRMSMLLGRPDAPSAEGGVVSGMGMSLPAPANGATTPLPMPVASLPSIGEAQAAVLGAMPDSILFDSLSPSPRGYRLHAHADNAGAVAHFLTRLAGDGKFAPYPATADHVALSTNGSFELELTPRK